MGDVIKLWARPNLVLAGAAVAASAAGVQYKTSELPEALSACSVPASGSIGKIEAGLALATSQESLRSIERPLIATVAIGVIVTSEQLIALARDAILHPGDCACITQKHLRTHRSSFVLGRVSQNSRKICCQASTTAVRSYAYFNLLPRKWFSFGSEIAVAEFQKDTILPVELGGMVASRSFDGGTPEEQLVFEAMLSTPRERLQLYRFKEDTKAITGEERLQKLEMVSIRTLDEDICEQTRNYGKLGLF
jgi:hypothetical protein